VAFFEACSALNLGDVVAFLEHLRREVPGRMVMIWDGSPIHRSHTIKEFLASGASPRLHLERLPAYAPELNPGEGLWQQLKGVELRHVCCLNIPHRRHVLCDAVKRVRRKPECSQAFPRCRPLDLHVQIRRTMLLGCARWA
jgi:transposase